MFLDFWTDLLEWLPALLLLGDVVVTGSCILWVLITKTNTTSAVAWCLLIIFLPFLGALFFFFFGYQHVNRPLMRKRLHATRYQRPANPARYDDSTPDFHRLQEAPGAEKHALGHEIARLARVFGAAPVTAGNFVAFYHEGPPCFDAMLEAIAAAKHHVHLEFFIFHPDILGCRFLDLLAQKSRESVQVRLLYDAMGSRRLPPKLLRPLRDAGGQVSTFLPLNPFRRRFQINMRNHRKILVVDGAVGFIGGLNIGDEYAGQNDYFGFWRDTHLRIEGPAVWDLQRIFGEDWSFAAEIEPRVLQLALENPEFFRLNRTGGPYTLQVVDSGPDRDLKGIREVIFAAIVKARRRVWIASPYFVPDEGLLDALRLAAYGGVDVRLLCQFKPDKWLPQYAARFFWSDVMPAGVQVYQYTRGMMHAKVIIVDDDWASVGTANLDNRSMFLNFEVNCLLYSPEAVTELEAAFLRDFEHSILLDRLAYSHRPLPARLLENACRLFSPVL
ncbi:MAG: cardiolipin synthase [Gemmataceae bacterium]